MKCHEFPFLLLYLALSFPAALSVNFYSNSICNGEHSLDETLSEVNVKCGTEVDYEKDFASDKPYDNNPPDIKYPGAKPDKKYTIIMADPDAPSHDTPGCRSWLHYILANIKGSDLVHGGKLTGTVVKEYNPPSPPPGTSYHRYFIYLFEQLGDSQQTSGPSSRCKFDVKEWEEDHNLMFIAANMFKTKRG